MPAHQVVLNPLESAVPKNMPISIQIAPVTSLECALTSHFELIENTATLSLAESALTSISLARPLESALTKNTGGTSLQDKGLSHSSLHPSTYLPSSVHTSKFRIPQLLCLPLLRKLPACGGILPISELATRHSPLATVLKFFPFTSLRTLLRFFALTKNSTRFFSIVSPLWVKKHNHEGGAIFQPSTFDSHRSPLHVQFPPRHPRRRHDL